jgi:glycosyltransferase involved in cell wall biosynthesis
MKTSVILCTKNRVDAVIRFTESLYNQIVLPDEFIVVDSSDEPLNTNKKFIDFFEKILKCRFSSIYFSVKGSL